MKVIPATWEQHKEIAALCKLSPYSKGFLDMYYIQEYYQKRDVLITLQRSKITGFIAVRHCKLRPYTSVYYMGVTVKRTGIGRALIEKVQSLSPWKILRLISEKANNEGLKFYKSLGFKVLGESTNKQGEPYWILERTK